MEPPPRPGTRQLRIAGKPSSSNKLPACANNRRGYAGAAAIDLPAVDGDSETLLVPRAIAVASRLR